MMYHTCSTALHTCEFMGQDSQGYMRTELSGHGQPGLTDEDG